MTTRTFGQVFLGSVFGAFLFVGFVTYQAHEAVTTAGRTFGIVAKGFVSATPYEDPEQAGDLADLEEAKERLKVQLVAAFGEKK